MKITSGDVTFEIFRLAPDDAAMLDRVAEDVFDEPVRPDRVAAYLAEPGHIMLVALVDDIVVGNARRSSIAIPTRSTELYIDEVGVSPAFQRKGIARAMVERMLAIGKELGCGEAWVGTEPDNLPREGFTNWLEVRR